MLACDMSDGCGATADQPCDPGCPSLATDEATAILTTAPAALDITSPEHDRVVALAVAHDRPTAVQGTDLARAVAGGARLAYAAVLREIDGERFTVAAGIDCSYVIDRWDNGWPVDTHQDARGAQLEANRRNTRNIRDGQAHLRAAIAAA